MHCYSLVIRKKSKTLFYGKNILLMTEGPNFVHFLPLRPRKQSTPLIINAFLTAGKQNSAAKFIFLLLCCKIHLIFRCNTLMKKARRKLSGVVTHFQSRILLFFRLFSKAPFLPLLTEIPPIQQ